MIKRTKITSVLLALLFYSQLCNGQEAKPFCRLLDYNINMLICYGQSLSVGWGATDSTSNYDPIISFRRGCNEWASEVDIHDSASIARFYGDSPVPLSSVANKNWPPVAAIAITWMELLKKENGIDLSEYDNRFLLSTPGCSGVSIEMLSKGTEYYQRLLLSVKKAEEFAKKSDKTFGVACLFWVQGEANEKDTEEQYYEKLKKIFSDLNTDIKTITKQKKDICFITYQMAPVEGCGPSFAQLKLAKEAKNVYMGGPMYQYEYLDIWHPKDRAVVGIQLGIAAKRIVDGTPLKLFSPVKYKIRKENFKWILHVRYDVPVPPMRFDTSGDKFHNLNGKQVNYGFALKNASGKNIISQEPTILKGNTLVIECTENPRYSRLSYAVDGHYGGGNLCDSQHITIHNKNQDYEIDNFCPAFKEVVIK